MSEEEKTLPFRAVLGSGRTLKVGEETWAISDPGTRVEFFDLISEARCFNGIVYFSVAQSVMDAGNPGEAVICARLRCNLGTAQVLHNIIGE